MFLKLRVKTFDPVRLQFQKSIDLEFITKFNEL